MSQTPLEALEALFADAQQASRRGPVQQGPARRPEPIRQLPLADTAFYLYAKPAEVAEVAAPPAPRPYPSVSETAPLAFPAPHREVFRCESGQWADRPWSAEAVRRYRIAGGFFIRGKHSFTDKAAAQLAYAETFDETPAGDPPPAFTPDSADELLEALFAERAATPTTWR